MLEKKTSKDRNSRPGFLLLLLFDLVLKLSVNDQKRTTDSKKKKKKLEVLMKSITECTDNLEEIETDRFTHLHEEKAVKNCSNLNKMYQSSYKSQ